METQKPNVDELNAYNYCVSFIDLLGQRDALRGEGLLPVFVNEEGRNRVNSTIRNSIGAIIALQTQAETMLRGVLEPRPDSPLRDALPPHLHTTWEEMQRTRVTTQRWSDGLVSFVCLGDPQIRCRMNGIFGILGLAGSICLLGLALRHPVRGAIDVAWGVELRPGELYGAAVARAYELESEVAQYPRIVVSSRVVRLLEDLRANPEQDFFSQNDRALADACLGMFLRDADGQFLLHYLGQRFQQLVTMALHAELYSKAREFVVEQLEAHRASENTKLAFRYSHLLLYFDAHPPETGTDDAQPSNRGER